MATATTTAKPKRKQKVCYSKGFIYKLCCNDTSIKEQYIGSSTSFVHRKRKHKQACIRPIEKEYNTRKYQFIREHGGWDNWQMIWVEDWPCNSKRELESRERHWYDIINADLNSMRPFITDEERKMTKKAYDARRKDVKKVYDKEYYQEHKLEKKAYHREYYEKAGKYNCGCGSSTINIPSLIKRHEQTIKHQEWLATQEWLDGETKQAE
jgi:hypothetical protein